MKWAWGFARQRLEIKPEACKTIQQPCTCTSAAGDALFLPYLKTVTFESGVPGVLNDGVLKCGHGCRRDIWPLLGFVPGKRCKKTPQNQSDDPSAVLMNTLDGVFGSSFRVKTTFGQEKCRRSAADRC